MNTILMADPQRYPRMTTQELRHTFLLSGLNQPGAITLHYLDLDRAVVGMALPVHDPIELPTPPELRASFFTERRELGALNVGGAGIVHVSGAAHELAHLDLIFIGRGNPDIRFESKDPTQPRRLLPAELSGTYAISGDRGPQGDGATLRARQR